MTDANEALRALIKNAQIGISELDSIGGGLYRMQFTREQLVALCQLRAHLTDPGYVRVPVENGKNRYGLDMSYFRNVINRELNRPLDNYKPDELARVCFRIGRAADEDVLREREFQPAATKETSHD